MSDISEVLTSKTNSVSPKELAKALLSGGIKILSSKTLKIILLTNFLLCRYYNIILMQVNVLFEESLIYYACILENCFYYLHSIHLIFTEILKCS